MKHLVGKEQLKEVSFMGDKVKIRKLSINDVMKVRDVLKAAGNSKDEDADQMGVLRTVLRMAVVDAEEMTDEDFNTFPPSDLTELSETILQYCGLAVGDEDSGNSLAKKK